MIVWTFQDRDCLDRIKSGVWYKDYGRYKDARIKDCDKQYIKDVTLPSGESITAAPIYTYGKIGNAYIPMFGVRLLAREFANFVGKMVWDLDRRVMLELWVDDKQILSAKHNCKSYEDDEDLSGISHSDFLAYCRKEYVNDDIECLIDCIHDYQIIAVREFKYVTTKSGNYGTCKVTTTYANPYMLPTFTCDLFVNGDGYLRERVENKLVAREDNYINMVQGKYGMRGAYSYFTVEEAKVVVCEEMWKKIYNRIKQTGIDYSKATSMQLSELFNTSDFIIEV